MLQLIYTQDFVSILCCYLSIMLAVILLKFNKFFYEKLTEELKLYNYYNLLIQLAQLKIKGLKSYNCNI